MKRSCFLNSKIGFVSEEQSMFIFLVSVLAGCGVVVLRGI